MTTPPNQPTGALAVQEGGNHYKEMKIQPVEFAHANGLAFIEASVVKYVTRHRRKDGAKDIRKAIHFLELLLQLEYGEVSNGTTPPDNDKKPVDHKRNAYA